MVAETGKRKVKVLKLPQQSGDRNMYPGWRGKLFVIQNCGLHRYAPWK